MNNQPFHSNVAPNPDHANHVASIVRCLAPALSLVFDPPYTPPQHNQVLVDFLTSQPNRYQDVVRMTKDEYDLLYMICRTENDPSINHIECHPHTYSKYYQIIIVIERLMFHHTQRNSAFHWTISHTTVQVWTPLLVDQMIEKLSETECAIEWFSHNEQLQYILEPANARYFPDAIGMADGINVPIPIPRTDQERRNKLNYRHAEKGWSLRFVFVCDRAGRCRFVSGAYPGATNEGTIMRNHALDLVNPNLSLLCDRLSSDYHILKKPFLYCQRNAYADPSDRPRSKPRGRHVDRRDLAAPTAPVDPNDDENLPVITDPALRMEIDRYNKRLSRERSLIERTFGVLVARFNILDDTFIGSEVLLNKLMKLAAMIGNFLLIRRRTWAGLTGLPVWMQDQLLTLKAQLEGRMSL